MLNKKQLELLDYEMENASPKEKATLYYVLKTNETLGREAAKLVRPTLRKHELDPSSPDFDEAKLFQLIEDQMKA